MRRSFHYIQIDILYDSIHKWMTRNDFTVSKNLGINFTNKNSLP